jgi:hypothetical protein
MGVESAGKPDVPVVTQRSATNWVERSHTLMAWAVARDDRRATHVSMLGRHQTGLKCECVCPACGGTLQAVNAGLSEEQYLQPGKQRPFFRHHTGQQRDACLKRVAQLAALQLLAERQEVDLPAPTASCDVLGASGDLHTGVASGSSLRARVVARQWVDEQTATLTLDNGKTICVCLEASQHVTLAGVDAVIVIRVDDPLVATLDPKEILAKVQLPGQWMCWARHWDDDELSAAAKADADARAREAGDLLPPELVPDEFELPSGLTHLQRSESVLHALLKSLLADAGWLWVPGLKAEVTRRLSNGDIRTEVAEIPAPIKIHLEDVRLERRVGRIVPDVLCRAHAPETGLPATGLLIEVAVTHRVDEIKAAEIERLGWACLELDVRLLRQSGRVKVAHLREAVRSDHTNKRWVVHPHLKTLYKQAEAAIAAEEKLRATRRRRAEERLEWFKGQPGERAVPAFLKLRWAEQDQGATAGESDQPRTGVVAALLERQGFPGLNVDNLVTVLRRVDIIRNAGAGAPADIAALLRKTYEDRWRTRQWTTLLLGAIEVYALQLPGLARSIDELRLNVFEQVASGEHDLARPDDYDATIAAAFPEMQSFLEEGRGTRREQQRAREQRERDEREQAALHLEAIRLLEEQRLRRLEQQRLHEAQEKERRNQAAEDLEAEKQAEQYRRDRAWQWSEAQGSPTLDDLRRRIRSRPGIAPGAMRRGERLLELAWNARAAGMSYSDFVGKAIQEGFHPGGSATSLRDLGFILPAAQPQ